MIHVRFLNAAMKITALTTGERESQNRAGQEQPDIISPPEGMRNVMISTDRQRQLQQPGQRFSSKQPLLAERPHEKGLDGVVFADGVDRL